MDKQMIEEMAKLEIEESAGFYSAFINDMRISRNKPASISKTIMTFSCPKKYILKAIGIPENAVVLTMEEYDRLKRVEAERDRIYEIKLDLENQLIEKGFTEYVGADEIERATRKETAEKFADKLRYSYTDYLDGDEISVGGLRFWIDEICKELTEGLE